MVVVGYHKMEQFVSTFSASGRPPKETCRQCRFRKVRCDGRRGERGCGDCDRLKFDCSFVLAQLAEPTPPNPILSGPQFIGIGASSDGASTSSTGALSTTLGSALPPSSPHGSTPSEPARVVERRRTSKACAHCRQQKVRCSGGAPCLACKKKGVACVYGTDRRRGSRNTTTGGSIMNASNNAAGTPTENLSPATAAGGSSSNTDDNIMQDAADDTSATSATTPGTTHSEPATVTHPAHLHRAGPLPPDLQALVEFYFNDVYPLPSFAFLHPPTTIQQCSEGGLEPCLAYAIAAVASHHGGPAPQNPGGDVELGWVQAAEDLVWKQLEAPSLARLQALLLVILYQVETGAVQRAFMLSSLATRAAAALRLSHERLTPADSPGNSVSSEVRRRTMWSLKLVERCFSMGLPEFELCPVDSIHLDLPCWEQEFSTTLADTNICVDRSPTTCDFGAYRLCIKLEMLRRDIVKLARSLPALYNNQDPASPGQLSALIGDFEHSLARVGADLSRLQPSNAQTEPATTLTADRMAQLIGTPWLPRHVQAHLLYHQCHCDLYRLFLRSCPPDAAAVPPPAVYLDAFDPALLARAERLCLRHATAVADILATLNHQSPRAPLLEFDTAVCGYHAARLLLFLSRLSDDDAAETTKTKTRPSEEWALSRAELCVASLRRFFLHSTLVRPVLEEMRKAIAVFTPRHGTPTTMTVPPNRMPSSPGPSTPSTGTKSHDHINPVATTTPPIDSSTNVSAAARVRQRLAIHSLLRQADFTEGEDEQQKQQQGGILSRGASIVVVPPPPPPGASQRGVSPRGTVTTAAAAAADGTDFPRADSSPLLSLHSPRPPLSVSDAESWPFRWLNDAGEFGGGGIRKSRESLGIAQLAGGNRGGTSLSLSSFSFPWLRRLESPGAGANG